MHFILLFENILYHSVACRSQFKQAVLGIRYERIIMGNEKKIVSERIFMLNCILKNDCENFQSSNES